MLFVRNPSEKPWQQRFILDVAVTQAHPLDSWQARILENQNHNVGLSNFMHFPLCLNHYGQWLLNMSPLDSPMGHQRGQ